MTKLFNTKYLTFCPALTRSFFFVSNFLGFYLANALVSGSGSGIPLFQDIEPSNSRDWLRHATLRFLNLAEQCQTQNFYLRCYNSDFDAVKSKFGLLIKMIKKTTLK